MISFHMLLQLCKQISRMHLYLLFLSVFCLLLSPGNSLRDLCQEKWSLTLDGKQYPAHLPSTVIDDLVSNKVLPADLYYRDNFLKAYEYETKDSTYQTSFTLNSAELSSERQEIIFEGLDTHAKVYLNGDLILESHNMFRRYQIAVKFEKLINNLTIHFWSPANHDIVEQKKFVQNHEFDLPANYSFSRKAAYHYGWDWGPRILSSGVWKPIYLSCYNEVKWDNFQIKQISPIVKKTTHILSQILIDVSQLAPNKTYELDVSVTRSQSNATVFSEKLQLSGREEYLERITWNITQNVQDYIWWIWELGQPKLFQAVATIKEIHPGSINGVDLTFSQTTISDFGFRTVKLIQESGIVTADIDSDSPNAMSDTSFTINLNGYDIYCRGGNYIPPEMSLSQTTDSTYETVVKNAVDQNFNMIRVWGGGHFEKDEFYSQCDKAGILIWHDLMFACALYPYDEEIGRDIEQEMRDNLKRLRHHPSLALWNGNNEVWIGWQEWGWKNGKTEEQKKIIEDMYRAVFQKVLPKVIDEVTPHIPYWETSPSVSSNSLETINSGDIHFWRVWGGGTPIEEYQKYIGRFNSEYGMQSMPDISTIQRFTAEGKDRELGSLILRLHERHIKGDEYLPMYVSANTEGTSTNLTRFSYFSQVMQSYALELAITTLRGSRSFNMGSLYWQLNDVWPVSSWATIDYYQTRKAAHYQIRKNYEPLMLGVFNPKPDTEGNYAVYVANDYQRYFNCHFELYFAFFNGSVINRFTVEKRVNLMGLTNIAKLRGFQNVDESQNSSQQFNHTQISVSDYFLRADMRCIEGKNSSFVFFYEKMKNRAILDPELKYEISTETKQIKIQTKNLASYVWIYEQKDGKHESLSEIEDNYFHLVPGEERTVNLGKSANVANVRVTSYELEVIAERKSRQKEKLLLRSQ